VSRWKGVFSLGSTAFLLLAGVGQAQSLPEEKGQADFQRICSRCHNVTLATKQRMTRPEWKGVVDEMVARGARGTPDELNNIVTYLAANYGKDDVAPVPMPAPVFQPPLSTGQIAKATELINANECLSCHRLDDMGSYVGPSLTGIGASRSADQIRASLVTPNKESAPENRSVRLVTGDGKTVTGRLLNQDESSVQVIDSSSGQLKSFEKADLHDLTIVTTNPMPSYANRMTAQEITDIVHYLSSLKDKAKP
jgi:putative heme-binding domain-containing protein